MRHLRRSTTRRLTTLGAATAAALVASLVSALPAGAAPAAPEGRIQYEGAADAVAGSYIVTLKADRARSGSAEGRALAAKYGADIERTYTEALNGYEVEASETEAKRLAADPAVADNSTAESSVTVSGVPGNAPSDLAVEVDITHTCIGDLQVQLIAPDGTAYTLKPYDTGGSADDIRTTYTVDASAQTANGTWKLRVSDNAGWDSGRLNGWALRF